LEKPDHTPSDDTTTSELPTTQSFIPIDTIIPEGLSTPTIPQLETLTISTCPQLQHQPQTIESTPNEISLDSLNQDHIDTVTHGFNPHAVTATEQPTNPFGTPIQQHTTSNIMHEAPYQEHVTSPHNYESELPPDIWARMSDKQRRNHTNRTRKKKVKKKKN
jgi:hypothetical protein